MNWPWSKPAIPVTPLCPQCKAPEGINLHDLERTVDGRDVRVGKARRCWSCGMLYAAFDDGRSAAMYEQTARMDTRQPPARREKPPGEAERPEGMEDMKFLRTAG
jgi:hypothetical protein